MTASTARGTPPATVSALDGIRFASELALLAALAVTGAAVGSGWSAVALAICFPVTAALVWGRFVAPKSRHLLADPARAAVEAVVFGAGVAGLALVGHPLWAVGLAVVAAVPAVGIRTRR